MFIYLFYKSSKCYLLPQIIILKSGTIAAAGNFETLSASGLDFASLLARDEQEEDKPDKEQTPTADTEDSTSLLQSSFRKRQMSIHSVSDICGPVKSRRSLECI
jgi:hypothetical protein